MLSENKFINTDLVNRDINKDIKVLWRCKKCKSIATISSDNIEDVVISDPHDPLDDYIQCNCCESTENLRKGTIVNDNGTGGLLYSDGSFIYIKSDKGVSRIA